MPLVGHPDRSQFAGSRQPGEAYCITPVRLHVVAGFLGGKRGSRHLALMAKARDQPVEPVPGRPSLVAEGQALVFSRKLGNELACRRLCGGELAEIAHLTPTAALGDGHCITRFRRIDTDESFAMMPH